MDLSEVNPNIRSSGHFKWSFHNTFSHVGYVFRIFTVTENRAVLLLRGKEHLLEPNTIVVLAPGEPYLFRNEQDETPFEMYCLSFDLTQVDGIGIPFPPPALQPQYDPSNVVDQAYMRGERDISELHLPLVVGNVPRECREVREIHDLMDEHALYYPERCSGLLKDVLFRTLAASQNMYSIDESMPDGQRGVVVAREVLLYIRNHYKEPINEATIAKNFRYHPYYLTRLTVRYYHITPYQYLIRCRVEEAMRLLCETKEPVADIATACGFTNSSHFSTVIRRNTGMSPKAVRMRSSFV